MTLQPGDLVGDFLVLEHLGSGGMGDVYKTEHTISRRVEAMKVLPLGIGRTPEEIRRFEQEIQAQARLQHPNIAALYSARRDRDSLALIMEYVEGEPLQRILERRRLGVAQAVGYARQALEALAYAHRNGVVHCDVSPANILVTREGKVKLTDFGLARAVAESDGSRAGIPAGSPWQMAPEQARGIDPVDARTDVYGMGAVLYEMLAGRKLFDAEGAFAILKAQLETIPAPVSRYNPDVPAALDAALAKALAKDPAARFQSADAFRTAIERAARVRRRTPLHAAVVVLAMAAVPRVVSGPGAPPARTIVEAQAVPEQAAPAVEAEEPAAAPEAPRRQAPRRTVEPRRAAPAAAPAAIAAAPVALPEAPHVEQPLAGAPALDVAAAEVPAPSAPAEAAREQKTGNRFVRALGKLNPFRKGNKEK